MLSVQETREIQVPRKRAALQFEEMKLVETQVTSQSISKLSDSSDGVNVHIEPVDSKKL